MVHEMITNNIVELEKKIEENNDTIKRLQVENTEYSKVVDELKSLK